jgi:hypothetical protein
MGIVARFQAQPPPKVWHTHYHNLHIIDKFRCQAILPLRRTKVEELID